MSLPALLRRAHQTEHTPARELLRQLSIARWRHPQKRGRPLGLRIPHATHRPSRVDREGPATIRLAAHSILVQSSPNKNACLPVGVKEPQTLISRPKITFAWVTCTSTGEFSSEMFLICQNKKQSSAHDKMPGRANRLRHKQGNLYAKRWTTLEKENTALARPNRRLQSACPRRAAPECDCRRQRKESRRELENKRRRT